MWKIGLTGSIATGKSTVLDMFAAEGVPVFSADAAVHALYAGEGAPVVAGLFPTIVHNGVVDRAALSALLVGHPERLAQLETAIHPLVRARMHAFLAAAEQNGAALAVADVPLLYETGYDYGLDRVALTMADEPDQRRRALSRPGMSVEKLDAILARQMPQAEKRQRADYVIYTSQPLAKTRQSVVALVEALRANPKGPR